MNLEPQQPSGAHDEVSSSGRDVLRDGDNSLLAGAIDVHVHGYPDAGPNWPMRTDDRTMVSLARDCGMRGIVLKSHFWPTMDRARMLNEELADRSFAVHGSITLNPLIGGVQPETVEAAAGHGARVVYLPTWGSANDNAHETLVRGRIIDREFRGSAGASTSRPSRSAPRTGSCAPKCARSSRSPRSGTSSCRPGT